VRLSARVIVEHRIGCACAVAAVALAVSPLTAAARSEHGSPLATSAGAGGTVYGGSTAQDLPVVIATSKNGRKVVKAIVAIRLSCTSGAAFTLPDGYLNMAISKKRKFGASFGPTTTRNSDGTTSDLEGTISGAFNKARTTVSGKWSFKGTDHDASGAVTDTCDSGSVSWKAKQ
jgi:hypothetical protein